MELSDGDEDAETIVVRLIDESMALERTGDIAAALSCAGKALSRARRTGNKALVAMALVDVARFQFRLQQYQAARELAEEALTLAAVDAPICADALLILGMCAAETDSFTEAETLYLQAIDLARATGQRLLQFRAMHNLGTTVYMPRGQFDLAQATSLQALRLGQENQMTEWLSYPLLNLAWVYQYTGQVAQARAALFELSQMQDVAAVTQGYGPNILAHLAMDEGNLEAAPELLAQAHAVAEATGDQGLGVDIRLGMSRYHRLLGNAPAARDWADDALKIASRTRNYQQQGQALVERSRATWLLGDLAAAEMDFQAAIGILTPLQANFDAARAAFLLAALLHSIRDHRASQTWRDAAQKIIQGGYAFLLDQERTLAYPLLAAYLNDPDAQTAALSARLLDSLERVPPPPLTIYTMGRFRVQQNNTACRPSTAISPDTAWRQRRAGELFRLLLTSHGKTLTRDQIIEALWPDKPFGAANTPFHQATSALRKVLEPELPEKFPSRYLLVEGGQVTLRLPAGSWVDFEAFENHIRKAEWQKALLLYQGEFLPDDHYADWAVTLRERLMQQFIAASLALAEKQLADGHALEALTNACRALEFEPWHENLVLIAMRAYLALQDRGGAIRIYKKLETSLREELDIAPGLELQDLYRSIRQAVG